MQRGSRVKIGAAVVLVLLACGTASQGAEPQVHQIQVNKLAFGTAPKGLHVNDIVEWANADILRHTATAADGSFDVDLPAGAKGRTVLKRAGIANYLCRFHPGMNGQLEVGP